MDPITQQQALVAAGAGGDPVYVDDVFSTNLWTGNTTTQTITNGIDLSGEGGLVWIKERSGADVHNLFDTERGAGFVLNSDGSGAQSSDTQVSSQKDLYQFNSTGYSIGQNYNSYVNYTNADYVGWTFRKCPGFFDVVTYTGNGSHRDISHSLGSEPGSIWIKRTDAAESWTCYHRSLHPGNGGNASTAHFAKLELESGGGQFGGTLLWSSSGGGEDHTASTFHVSSHDAVNGNGMSYVAYIFAHDDQSFGDAGNEAIIKCGSYTGTGAAGNQITLGFEPQWLLVKNISTDNQNWEMFDNMRGVFTGGKAAELFPNTDAEERDAFNLFNFNATGFETESTLDETNVNGDNYIYIAIRRPHKPPSAGTDVFAVDQNTQSTPEYISNFVVDWGFHKNTAFANDWESFTRLTGGRRLALNSAGAEGGTSQDMFGYMDGFAKNQALDPDHYGWMFRRAPGFFDVVTYAGNSTSGRTVPHNLGVVPELMIIKSRDGSRAWRVYDANTGASGSLRLNSDGAKDSNSAYWSTPTVDNIILGNDQDTNSSSYDYVAYLFATLPGVSKVGSYTGNGSTQDIDCGFTNGARFVLIKRTDSADNWHLFDTTQGINSGADPYLRLNLGAAQVTGNDFIDPLNSGFTLASSDGGTNASNGTYIFLAIA